MHMTKPCLLAALLFCLSLTALGEVRCNNFHAEYSALEKLCPYQEGLAAFKIRHKWGFVDAAGQVVVEPAYDEVNEFSSGLAAVAVDEKWGFIDKSGTLRIPLQYAWVEHFSEGLAAAEVNGKHGYINADNQLIIPAIYTHARPFMNGVAEVGDESGRSLLIDKTGNVVKSFDDDISLEGWHQPFGRYVATVKYRPFLINADGRRLELPLESGDATSYGDGLLTVSKIVGGTALHGVMDLNGVWLVEPRFAAIQPYSSGLAIATTETNSETGERTFGLIDKRGEFVVPAIYYRLDRGEQGQLLAYRKSPESQTDVFNAAGKLLFSFKCEVYQSPTKGSWAVFPGCDGEGETWVITPQGRPERLAITAPEISQAGDYLLLSKENEPKDGESGDPYNTFFILAPQGKVLSSEDQAIKGKYDWVWLVSSGGELARATPQLLPAAILVKGYREIAILSRDHKIVSHEDWKYESELLDYRYNSSKKALEGPFVVNTENAWGAVDGQGQWVIPPGFMSLTSFRHGLAFGTRDGEDVIVDNDGRIIPFPPGRGYRRIAPFFIAGFDDSESQNAVIYRISDGKLEKVGLPPGVTLGDHAEQWLASARTDENWGLLDIRCGQWALAPIYPAEPEPLHQESHLIGWKTAVQVKLEKTSSTRHGLVSPLGQELVKPLLESISEDHQKGPLLRTKNINRHEGLIDASGKEILGNMHDSITYADHGWYLARRAEQKGLLNTRGEWSVLPGPYWFYQLEKRPYSREVTNDDKTVHVHVDGAISTREKPQAMVDDRMAYWWSVVEGTYGDNETVFYGFDWRERLRLPGEIKEGFADDWVVLEGRKNKQGHTLALANSSGNLVGPLPYERIESLSNGLFLVSKSIPIKQKKGVNESGERRVSGYINSQGKVVIPLRFEAADSFSEDRAIVLSRGNLGVIDKSGKLILHSAWRCGKYPVLLDGKEKIIWPKNETKVCP